ncbi:hypothetical protein [Carnobacterium mobile]|uniref:hypothetical protein n=1 Tax=Carnobacterium mobile TaxID=2750 RepID=UPI00054E6062|nr:hypothetical protein [Carnobacterium mobile]
MKVKELKEYLSTLPNNMEVTISDGKGYLIDVSGVNQTITREFESTDLETQVVVIYPMFVEEDAE